LGEDKGRGAPPDVALIRKALRRQEQASRKKETLMLKPAEHRQNPTRKSIEAFSDKLKHVEINHGKIRDIAKEWAGEDFGRPKWDLPVFPEMPEKGDPRYKEKIKNVIDFFFIANSINFYYKDANTQKKFTASYGGKDWKGAFGMFASLKKAVEKDPQALSAERLSKLTVGEAKKIFEPSVKGHDMPSIERRVEILREIGKTLKEKYDGHFSNLLEKAGHKAFNGGKGIVERTTKDFPSYSDTMKDPETGHKLVFNKRAQLALAMAYEKVGHENMPVEDIEALTVFPDYELPRALEGIGAIKYLGGLHEDVMNERPLKFGSRQELEIRAATVKSTEMLIREINGIRLEQGKKPISALEMDYRLWMAGKKVEKPHPIVITEKY
jgi:hypothetical protein